MAISLATVASDTLAVVPDLDPSVGPYTNFLDYVNRITPEILGDAEILSTTTVTATVVTGQQDYTLGDSVLKVLSCYYTPQSGAISWPLIPTSQSTLDTEFPGWRDTTIKTIPSYYFNDGDQIGVYPTSSVTASAGFPILSFYVVAAPTYTIASSLPAQVKNDDAWVYGVAQLFAEDRRPQDVQRFRERYKLAKQQLLRSTNYLIDRKKPSVRVFRPRLRAH